MALAEYSSESLFMGRAYILPRELGSVFYLQFFSSLYLSSTLRENLGETKDDCKVGSETMSPVQYLLSLV